MISRSQFDDDGIIVQGFPWCQKPRKVGLASLVARNLCRNHNTALSPADLEAKRYKDALGAILNETNVLPVRLSLEARLIERWLLKTTINLALQEPGSGIDLSDSIVRRAFGLENTPRSQGFFAVAELGEQLTYTGSIRFESMVRKTDGKLVMGVFVWHG